MRCKERIALLVGRCFSVYIPLNEDALTRSFYCAGYPMSSQQASSDGGE
jgi:hypothetical protein